MSSGSTMKRRRAKATRHTPAGQQPVCYLPSVVIPTGPAPLCKSHLEPMVFTACECHPKHSGDWQCARAPLNGHMKRVR